MATGSQGNPCTGLEQPAVRGRRERYADPREGEALIAAVPQRDRVIWATAMYAGLRRGELRALRVEDIDLEQGLIRVERGWDPYEGEIKLKSSAGRRKVSIIILLRTHLIERLNNGERSGRDRVFGATPTRPFTGEKLSERADEAWKSAGLDRITLHECRHTFASLMIAAGVNAKALSTFMGHANISITLDRYGQSDARLRGGGGRSTRCLSRRAAQAQDRLAPHWRTNWRTDTE